MNLEKILTQFNTHFFSFIGIIFVIRCVFLLSSNIALVGDESYYWDWSRQLDWCYFSKPPMVAWLIAGVTYLFGDFATVIRLPAVITSTLFIWFYYQTAKEFYGLRVAALSTLLILATPENVLSNLFMTIDPPLDCFWMMSLYFLRKAIFDKQNLAWIWAGCAAGGAILSKQVAILLPIMLLVFLVIDKSRHKNFKFQFWLFLIPFTLASLPILLWNASHDWIMFSHSKTHFTTQVADSIFAGIKYFFDLIFFQLLLVTPLIFGMTVSLTWQYGNKFKSLSEEQQFLFVFGPLLLILVLSLSLFQKVQGNWPMPFYFTSFILLSHFWETGHWRKYISYALKSGFVLVSITYLLPTLLQIFHLQDSVIDPTRRFNHWPELANQVQIQRHDLALADPDDFIIAIGHRNLVSQLAFYLPEHPHIFQVETKGEISSQYELWPGPFNWIGKDAFIISDTENPPDWLKTGFEKFIFIKKIANPVHEPTPFYLFKAERLIFWPAQQKRITAQD